MSKQEIKNERLDQIGRQLLEAARVRDDEIEQIIAAPQLFDSVRREIKACQRRQKSQPGFFGDRASFTVWSRQKAAGALAVLTLLLTVAVGLFIFKNQDLPQLAKQPVTAENEQQKTPVGNPPPPQFTPENTPEIGKITVPGGKKQITAQQTDFKTTVAKTRKPVPKQNRVKREPKPKTESEGVFYPLVYAGNLGENGEDLQIVRAELSASSLFALGVDLPVENVTGKIKTDLLVGADGVARAIRFVK